HFGAQDVLISDVITDFKAQSAADKIDVSSIDANTELSGPQHFTFLGTGSSFSDAGEIRYHQDVAHNTTFVDFNTDVASEAEMEIRLTGLLTLVSSDVIL